MQVEAPGRRAIMHLAAVVVVLAGVKAASALISLILLAAFGAIMTLPIFRHCKKMGFSELLSRFITVGIVLLMVAGVGTLVVTSIEQLVAVAPAYGARMNAYQESFFLDLAARGIDTEPIRVAVMGTLEGVAGIVGSAASGIVSVASSTLVVVILLFFFVLDGPVMGRTAERMMATDDNPFGAAMDDILSYLLVKTKVSILTGVIIGVVLWMMGIPFAFLLGFTAFALNYIPNLGSLIAAIPGLIVALSTGGPDMGLGVIVLYGATNLAIGSLLEPKLMGDKFGLPPTVILLSLIFWGWLLGPVGALLAVPLTLSCKLLFSRVEDWRWLSEALSVHEEE